MDLQQKAKNFCSFINTANEIIAVSENTPPQLKKLLKDIQPYGDEDTFVISFALEALLLIAENSFPENPYDSKNFKQLIEEAAAEGNIKLRAWLHSRMERADFLAMAQKEYGPIQDGSELMIAAKYIERREIYNAVRKKLSLLTEAI